MLWFLSVTTMLYYIEESQSIFNISQRTRLINPIYSEIGQIRKQTVKRINNKIRETKYFNQRTNSEQVISWFESLEKSK